jgi:hypothetical protein
MEALKGGARCRTCWRRPWRPCVATATPPDGLSREWGPEDEPVIRLRWWQSGLVCDVPYTESRYEQALAVFTRHWREG